jgi:hypothetical protein
VAPTSAASRRARLAVHKAGRLIDTVPLGGRACVVLGRNDALADIVLAHASVSRQQAAIVFDGAAFWAIDLGSTHGSWAASAPAAPGPGTEPAPLPGPAAPPRALDSAAFARLEPRVRRRLADGASLRFGSSKRLYTLQLGGGVSAVAPSSPPLRRREASARRPSRRAPRRFSVRSRRRRASAPPGPTRRAEKPRAEKPRAEKPRAEKPRAEEPRAEKPRTARAPTDLPRA